MVICVLYFVESKLRQKGERDNYYLGWQHHIFMRYGNLLADHDFIWNSQSTQPSNEKLKLNHSTIGCLYFARAPTTTSCQPFAWTRLQILQQGASSLVAWKLINCRNIILSAVDIVPELKKSIGKTRHTAPQSQKPVPALQKKLEVSRFAISFDRQPFPQTHPLQHWITKTKMKEKSL